MSTEPITTTQKPAEQQNRQWARLAMLIFTIAGPAISATIQRLRKRAETTTTAQAVPAQTRQGDVRDLLERLEDLTKESREGVAQQVDYLRSQARLLQEQSRQLGKAMRAEARQRRKLLERASEAGLDWSQEMLKRGEQFTGDVIERGGKATHGLLAKRSRARTFVGFGVGMLAAGAITYRLVRWQAARRKAEDEPIELDPATATNGNVAVAEEYTAAE